MSVMLFLRFHCSNNTAFGIMSSDLEAFEILNSYVMIQYILRVLCYSGCVKVHGIYP